jgi:hypothetical protein
MASPCFGWRLREAMMARHARLANQRFATPPSQNAMAKQAVQPEPRKSLVGGLSGDFRCLSQDNYRSRRKGFGGPANAKNIENQRFRGFEFFRQAEQ